MDGDYEVQLNEAEMRLVYAALEREFDTLASVALVGDGVAEIELVDSALLKIGAALRGSK